MTTFVTEDRIAAYIGIEQGTEEWLKIRLGKVTASGVADVLAKTKSGPSASRGNYLIKLAIQRVTGVVEESYTNDAMQWGKDYEAQARVAYEVASGNFVDQVGFVEHPSIAWFGCSPDGLVNDNGLVEIKCMQPKGHWEVIKSKTIPKHYWIQQQAQIDCCQRDWNDYVGFNPLFPERSKLFILRTYRDDEFIKQMNLEIKQFLEEVKEETERIKNGG